jgi:hypothetical protein
VRAESGTPPGQPQQTAPETILGAILYGSRAYVPMSIGAAYTTGFGRHDDEHEIYSLFFTDRRVLAVHSSKLSLPGVIPYAPMAANQWNSLNRTQKAETLQMRSVIWTNLSRGVGKNSAISITHEVLSQEILKATDLQISYSDMKNVKFVRNIICFQRNSGDWLQWSLISPKAEVLQFLRTTPLASRLS